MVAGGGPGRAPGGAAGGARSLEALAGALGDLAERDVAIGLLTTYRVGGRAALYVEPRDERDLARLAAATRGSDVPVLVLGKGSNLLVADAGWSGLCVHAGDALGAISFEGSDVRAGAGTPYPVLARRCAAAGLVGMEWAVGIPGSVGGAVRMNAGGHGAETSEWLVSAHLLDLASGEERVAAASELELSYRRSAVRPYELVTEAVFRLEAGDPDASLERISEIVRWRRENQPGGQNAGSVFTNPPGDSAGRLIDEAGLKGLRIGTAAVSEKHANFFQADQGGSADDVRRLVETVREEVRRRLGVELAVELQMVGFAGG